MRSFNKFIICIFFGLSILCTCGDIQGASYQPGIYILKRNMKLRSAPKKTGKYLKTIKKGIKVTVKKVVKTKWGKVTYKKKTGYISLKYAKYLKASKKTAVSKPKTIDEMLAASKTGKTTSQIITVIPNGTRLNDYPLYDVIFWQKSNGKWKKAISVFDGRAGKNGLNLDRIAGDKTTPIGSFELTMAFGLPENPGTKMTYKQITENSWWGGTKWGEYAQKWYEGSRLAEGGEHLINYGDTYKYCMNIGFNMDPVIDGKGACIFLHCFSSRAYTSGCVAVSEDTMLKFLKKAKNGAYIIIVPSQEDILNY